MRTARMLSAMLALSLAPIIGAVAEPSQAEQALQDFLDKEYKQGLFTIGNRGKDTSGAYKWAATFHRELRKPLEKLTGYCQANGASMVRLLSAGAIADDAKMINLSLGEQTFEISHFDLWAWESRSGLAEPAKTDGFDAVIPAALIAGRTKTIAAADADPPLGLFGCHDSSGDLIWAASIMPGEYGGSGWFYITIRPVTADFIVNWQQRQLEIAMAAETNAANAVAENQRLAAFRKILAIGSQTNCGLVIDDRGPVLEVQLPPAISSPNGERRFWVRRNVLTDYPVPEGCTFGR
jgi:hypothetical protein